MDMLLPAGSYNCSFPQGSGGKVALKFILEPAPSIPEAVNIVIDAAVFDATNLTFIGPLTITLPSTAWTTNNSPLRLLILDGTSGVSLQVYIAVTGIVVLPFKAVLLHLRANL